MLKFYHTELFLKDILSVFNAYEFLKDFSESHIVADYVIIMCAEKPDPERLVEKG